MKEESFAKEILQDYKRQNRRLFVIIIVILLLWTITIVYLLFTINKSNNEEIAYTQISDIKDSNLYLGI